MILTKEEFVGGEKYRRAYKLGRGEAIMMWLALKCYASQHPSTAGFIPDENIDDLPGAPRQPRKALEALVDCGRLLPDGTRGHGLVERAEGGWQLHDYLDHAAAPEDDELRREKSRLKKARQREDKRRELDLVREQSSRHMSRGTRGGHRGTCPGGQEGDTGGHVPGDVPGTVLAGARPPLPARVCTPTRVCARSQPSPTQPNPSLSSEERDRGQEPEGEPELSSGTRDGERWKSFPKGWRAWSIDTAAAAVALGLTTEDLIGHVKFWTVRDFTGGSVTDLDGELQRSLEGIAERKRRGSAPPQAPPAPDPYAWAPTAAHRAFANARVLRLRVAADAYRAARMPDDLGTLRANEDFMRRLHWWADNGGEFPATGKLPRPAREAVGA